MLEIFGLKLKREFTDSEMVRNEYFVEASGKMVSHSKQPYRSVAVEKAEFFPATLEEATHFIAAWEEPIFLKGVKTVKGKNLHNTIPEIPTSRGNTLKGEDLADWLEKQVFPLSLLEQVKIAFPEVIK